MVKNKKGAEMTIGTIIVIVLALIVLVILVYGFSTGWSNLWGKITGLGGGEVNVQTEVQSCQIACTTGSQYDYCTKTRKVTFTEDTDPETITCAGLEGRGTGLECPAMANKCGNPENCANLGGQLYEINEANTGCPDGMSKIGSTDTVAPGEGVAPVWCCK